MIVSTTKTIGIQCSNCGELQYISLSLFGLSNFNPKSVCRSCGTSLVKIADNGKGTYIIQYPCIYCGEFHFMTTKKEFFWSEQPLQLICNAKKVPIGYIGTEQFVKNACQDIMNRFVRLASQLVNDGETDTEADNFFVVYAVMEMLGKMAQKGELGCKCGSKNLSVEIMNNCIEIKCTSCRAKGIIYTDNKDILCIINNMREIFLEEEATVFINECYQSNIMVKK